MKLGELKRQLSEYTDDEKDVVLFANGYKEIKIVESEDGLIIAGKGIVCPSIKTAVENMGEEYESEDLCSCDDTEDDRNIWVEK